MIAFGTYSRWIVAVALAALAGCSTNPMTGRSQFMMVSEETAIKSSASAYTNMMGQYSKKNIVEAGTPRVERVNEITNRLVAQAVRFRADSADWNWEVQVIDDPKTVNAFCMAGGKMGIYSGMWEKLHATDDEIAQVMGHEIGHALASHTREKMSVGIAAGLGATVLAAAASSRNQRNDPGAFQRNQDAFALAAALAITLPNSREAESEADQIGIELAARAGYDPRAAVTLWKKMAAEGGGPIEFLSTHPSPENRMQRLETLIAKVDPLYQAAKDQKPGDIPLFVGYTSKDEAPRPSREEYVAKVSNEPTAMTFVSDEFEKFRKGEIVLTCAMECALGYSFQKSKWKEMHEKKAWRDLALAVIKNGYQNDLTYFLLGEAAKGLNLPDAAKAYYSRALEARKSGKTCEGVFNTCDGFEVGKVATAAVASKK